MTDLTGEELMAARLAVVKADQHNCALRSCDHENHRRDLNYGKHLLETLGLVRTADSPPLPETSEVNE